MVKSSEHIEAREWRRKRGLTVEQLSEHTGYSREAIYCFERGRMANGTDVPEWVWLRFKMACAGVEAQIRSGLVFQWGETA